MPQGLTLASGAQDTQEAVERTIPNPRKIWGDEPVPRVKSQNCPMLRLFTGLFHNCGFPPGFRSIHMPFPPDLTTVDCPPIGFDPAPLSTRPLPPFSTMYFSGSGGSPVVRTCALLPAGTKTTLFVRTARHDKENHPAC